MWKVYQRGFQRVEAIPDRAAALQIHEKLSGIVTGLAVIRYEQAAQPVSIGIIECDRLLHQLERRGNTQTRLVILLLVFPKMLGHHFEQRFNRVLARKSFAILFLERFPPET